MSAIKNILALTGNAVVIALLILSSCASSANSVNSSKPVQSSDVVSTNVSGTNPNTDNIGEVSIAISSDLVLSQTVKNDSFSVNIPSDWIATNIGDNGYTFGKNKDDDIGGIYPQEFNAGENETMPTIKNLIGWMLPNHSETTSLQKISGFPTDTYLLNVITSNTASSGDSTAKTWTYIILADKNKTTASRFAAYEIFINTEFVSEQDALKIAKSFTIL